MSGVRLHTVFILIMMALIACMGGAVSHAGNIDPNNDGSSFAYGENIGWLNLKPSFGTGITVTNSAVTGYAWGENIGWINLSPQNGGVFNDGAGNLYGNAWGENVGWINFAPAGGGVTIDPNTGIFSGKAWGENAGWVSFSSTGAVHFSVKTSWRSMLSNPGFESGTSPWVFYTNGTGTFLSDAAGYGSPHAGHIKITTQGSNIQLNQAGLALEPNTQYILRFKAYSNTGHDFSVSLLKHASPYTNYGLSNLVFNITTSWSEYSVQFTTTGFSGTVSDGRLMFLLAPYAAAGDNYYIDNVVLSKVSSTTPVPPSVTTHPANQAVTAGQTAAFSVAATGTATLSYQWQKNSANISGATAASYTTPAATLTDDGSTFRCIVTNSAGSTTSNAATLNVTTPVSTSVLNNPGFESGTSPWVFYTNGSGTFLNDAPGNGSPHAGHIKITTQGTNVQLNQAGLTLEPNTQYILRFKAYSNTGHDLSVSLQKHVSPYTNYGLSNSVFNITPSWSEYSVQFTTTGFSGTVSDGRLMLWFAPYAAAGDNYFIDDVMLSKASSAPPVAPTVTTHPADQAVTAGQTATFSVVATGTAPLSYQWQNNGVNISGATAASYTTPVTTLADSGSTFRCIVTNSAGSATSNTATLTVNAATNAQPDWWNSTWRYRVPLDINTSVYQRTDKPVNIAMNFTQSLTSLGLSGSFNENSIRVIEVNSAGAILDSNVMFQFDKDSAYNANTNAGGTLVFLLGGTTAANAARHFHVYFETGGSFTLPSFTPQVSITDNVLYEGQTSFRIVTPGGRYYYHKQGAGFARIEDINGNDWIGYHVGGGSAGEYRGIPNLGAFGHPGYTNGTSSILNQGPIKTTISSQSTDGLWKLMWEIYPQYATMTIQKAGENYWLLYEGTPGGQINPATDYWKRSSGELLTDNQVFVGDIASPEWVYFGDGAMNRFLYLAHHEDDNFSDQYWPMENNMTVFGFGRQYPCCNKYLTAVPAHLTIGLGEDAGKASEIINGAFRDLSISVSSAEIISGGSVSGAPGITSHPANKTATQGQTATFNVIATGTAPLTYQWQKNGVNISGATAASYTTPATTLADSGATFRCIASNLYGSATSSAATLTVTQGGASNNQLVLINRTFVHSTSYSAALLGETPSPTNSNCIYVSGISYNAGQTGSDVCNHEAFKFFQMPSSNPGNWSSPIDYAHGTLYQRVEIIEKPTTTPARYALCMFQDQVLSPRHACGDPAKISFTSPGIYYSSQSMTTFFQYSTAVDWTKKPHVIMLHMTDDFNHQPDSYTGFMNLWFGTPNWGLYYPMKLRYTAIVVPPGGGSPVWP